MGSANRPTAWEVAITTVERDLARLDYDLPPLFYATETLAVPADRRHPGLRGGQHLALADRRPAPLAEPGPTRPVRGGAGLVDRSRPHDSLGGDPHARAWCWPSSTTSTRRPATPARRPRPSPDAVPRGGRDRDTSGSSPTRPRWPRSWWSSSAGSFSGPADELPVERDPGCLVRVLLQPTAGEWAPRAPR